MLVYSCKCLKCEEEMDLISNEDLVCVCGGGLMVLDKYDFDRD